MQERVKKSEWRKNIISFVVNKNTSIIRYLAVIGCVVFIAGLFPRNRFNYDYELGKPWKYENLYAPFKFAIEKLPDSLLAERKRVAAGVNPYYRLLPQARLEAQKQFDDGWQRVYLSLKDKHGNALKSADTAALLRTVRALLDTAYASGVVELNEKHKRKEQLVINLMVQQNKSITRPVSYFYGNVTESCRKINELLLKKNNAYTDSLSVFLCQALVPSVVYDDSTTQKITATELSNISPTAGVVQQNEVIIAQGALVTEERYRVLESLKNAYNGTSNIDAPWSKYNTDIGYFIITLLVIGTFVLLLQVFHPTGFYNSRELLFLLGAISVFLYIVKIGVSLEKSGQGISLYVLPFCNLAIVVRSFFGSRVAHYAHIALLLLTGFMIPLGYEFLFMHFVAGLLAIVLSERTYYWSQFFATTALLFLCYVTAYVGIILIQSGSWAEIKPQILGWLMINGFLTLLAYPLIPLFEKMFGFVSSITLAELCDLNKPLLKSLSEKAPGTFSHTLQVSNLAEAACTEIGANALLAKTGALYHDIGKEQNPGYFIENQRSEINPHDDLDPAESAAIIKAHVTHGIELARRERLPNIIIDFIRTHHGNTRIELFYQQQQRKYTHIKPDESLFRYPGPLPYSKETAVVMIADSVEAASRSLHNPSEEEINNLVDGIVEHKIKQGQFVNCNISFKDIVTVKKVLKKRLRGMYHVRINYPKITG